VQSRLLRTLRQIIGSFWRQVNGSWKIQSNIWNSDAPVPTPK
jgi:hypothetical protein